MAAASSPDNAPLPSSACCSSAAELPATVAAAKPKGGKRPRRPDIDLDSSMRRAREEVKKAAAEVARHRAQIRIDKKKKQRLVKKAGSLSAQDLERIAVMKRCGLWSHQDTQLNTSGAETSAGSASSGSTSAASTPEMVPVRPPPETTMLALAEGDMEPASFTLMEDVARGSASMDIEEGM